MDYTENLQNILRLATQEAERLNNPMVEPQHLLLAILRYTKGLAYRLLIESGIDPISLKQALDARFMQPAAANSTTPYSRTTARILRITEIEAQFYNCRDAGSAHLLLSILRERVNYPAMYLDEQYGITYEKIESLYPKPQTFPHDSTADYDVEDSDDEEDGGGGDLLSQLTGQILGQRTHRRKKDKNGTPTLTKYGRDLTMMAADGQLDPVEGREVEIARVMQILLRRKKNNPILIGEPGVGKSAIVEGLAQRIVAGRAKWLNECRIISLDLSSIVAGTTYRGQFEQRMKEILTELRNHPEIILFIDEIHTLIGAGNAQGSLDAANILKPALSRGEVQCIGATTTSEYRTSIEKDGALERRFQKVMVEAPKREDVIKILQRLSECYGEFHHVTYTREALQACVELTDRYISDRSQPDKAVDAMDEAGSRYVGRTITPEEIAHVVSHMSGVPIQRVARAEHEQLLRMDTVLRSRVIGQDAAINKVVRAIRRSRLGMRDPNRPIGTFFFLGSTGVGKTYLAQCLAEEMFGSKEALTRFDMSEYMEKHTVSLLVGAPPGYIAHEEGGKLTEAVRRRPYSIILFDEIEKAHPDIFNVLLQVLDEGRMTDRQGRRVDFRNTIIILTSNVGTRQLREFGAGVGFDRGNITQQVAEQTMVKALQKTFPPEFVNRIDDVISFAPLSRESLEQILDIEVAQLQQRMRHNGRTLKVGAEAKAQLLERAYDPNNGARPIKRAVQTYLEDAVTDILLRQPERKYITLSRLPEKKNSLT